MRNNKTLKGAVLIELIIFMAILGTSYISMSVLIKSCRFYENNINADYTGGSIMMFINRSKQYCASNNCSGFILIDIINNKMRFYISASKCIEQFYVPSGIKLLRSTAVQGKIEIDQAGSTSDAQSIYYSDSYGKERKVTIRVGSEYVHAY